MELSYTLKATISYAILLPALSACLVVKPMLSHSSLCGIFRQVGRYFCNVASSRSFNARSQRIDWSRREAEAADASFPIIIIHRTGTDTADLTFFSFVHAAGHLALDLVLPLCDRIADRVPTDVSRLLVSNWPLPGAKLFASMFLVGLVGSRFAFVFVRLTPALIQDPL